MMNVARLLFAVGFLLIGCVRSSAQTETETKFTTGVIILSLLENGSPLSFVEHQVEYENLGPVNALVPTVCEARLLKPHKYPYQRALVIPEHISIGVYKFKVTGMGVAAFQQTGVRSVDLKADVRTIPQNCFLYCDALEMVRFRGNAPHFIDAAAFQGCSALKSITFPAQLKRIGTNAFSQCRSLQEVIIPKDVAEIGDYAFYYCTSLKSVTFSSGHFRVIPAYCFQTCESLEEIEIPEGVSTLGEFAFNKSGLRRVTLPASLRRIDRQVFSQTPLSEIRCHSLTPPQVGAGFTREQCARIVLHVPARAEAAYRADVFWKNFSHIVADL